MYFLTNNSSEFNIGAQKEHHQNYNFEVNFLVQKEFENNQKVKTLFHFAGDVLFNEKRKFSSGPYVILISGPSSKTTHFFNHLRHLLEKHYLSEALMDYEIKAEKSPSRLEFESVTFDHLRAHNKKILLLRGIDNLIGASPLVLHSLSDPESSPFKASFVVASVTPENMSEGHKNCEDNVLKYVFVSKDFNF